MAVEEAAMQLAYTPRKGARMLRKTLKSAVANAERQAEVRREQLKVMDVRVDEGPRLKRSKPKNKGGSHPIRKRMSHFTVVVGVE
jgi:large subunit ribosomal protein L22